MVSILTHARELAGQHILLAQPCASLSDVVVPTGLPLSPSGPGSGALPSHTVGCPGEHHL